MNNFPQSIYNWYRNTLRNPKYRWWLILGSMLYIISPLDFLPDVFPIIGQIDDVVILSLLVSEVSQLLIDTAKARKGDTVVSDVSDTNNTTEPEKTVDVDAVSVK